MARGRKATGITLAGLYAKLAHAAKEDLKAPATGQALQRTITMSLNVIAQAHLTPLVSSVPTKSYSMAVLRFFTEAKNLVA
jgi:hypothetical protein